MDFPIYCYIFSLRFATLLFYTKQPDIIHSNDEFGADKKITLNHPLNIETIKL